MRVSKIERVGGQGGWQSMPSVSTQTDPTPSFTLLESWYGRLSPDQQEFAAKNWSSLMEVAEYRIQEALDNEMEEQKQWNHEEVYDYVEQVDDHLEFATVQPGEDGWTELYRQYCLERPLEHLPKFPAEGFRIYNPLHRQFLTQREGDRVVRETSYFQTMGGGDGTYVEKGYFVRHSYTSSGYSYQEEVFSVARKPLGAFEVQALAGAEVEIHWNKDGSPATIAVRQKK